MKTWFRQVCGRFSSQLVMPLFGPSPIARAEERLFSAGLAWWGRWTAHHHGPAREALPSLAHRDVPVSDELSVHMVAAAAPDASADALPLVCLHGYGSGCGMYYSTLAPLAEAWPGPVYVHDTPWCGQFTSCQRSQVALASRM